MDNNQGTSRYIEILAAKIRRQVKRAIRRNKIEGMDWLLKHHQFIGLESVLSESLDPESIEWTIAAPAGGHWSIWVEDMTKTQEEGDIKCHGLSSHTYARLQLIRFDDLGQAAVDAVLFEPIESETT